MLRQRNLWNNIENEKGTFFKITFKFLFRWGFTPLIEAERFQHDFVFRYLAKHVEDNFPEALEELLKKNESIEKTSQR